MSQAAKYVDPAMLEVHNLRYDSWETVYFQRATVLVTELVLLYALHLYVLCLYCSCDHTRPDQMIQLREDIALGLAQDFPCGSSLHLSISWSSYH